MIGDRAVPTLWLFLGDSLTEGIGHQRVSWVTQLADLLRARLPQPVHAIRLRMLDLSNWQDLSHFNFAGHFDPDTDKSGAPLWLVNLAAESTTIDSDVEKMALIAAIRPDRIFVMRGPLETIVRPVQTIKGCWPRWVPRSWRSLAAMDPRCYFSAAIWRRAKQVLVDRAKQRVRLGMLKDGGLPLLTDERFLSGYETLLDFIAKSRLALTILAIPPVSRETFPGTMERVLARNHKLADLARLKNVGFVDWMEALDPSQDGQFLRDGFHPTALGALEIAKRVHEYVVENAILDEWSA